jgi:hypothetical protein
MIPLPLYYQAVLKQACERARTLKDMLAKPVKEAELTALRQRCEDILDGVLEKLKNLESSGLLNNPEMFPRCVSMLKNIIEELGRIETTGVAALDRMNNDDIFLTRLVFRVHKEIGYPILPPAVTCLSREYYSVFVRLNLIQVPLAEAACLLHLPDLYHEMGHTLAATVDIPAVEPFTNALGELMEFAGLHFEQEYIRVQRDMAPQELGVIHRQLEEAWIKYWSQEIFCDLFALYTLGPAYAWSHFHLVAEQCGDPYAVSIVNEHPPDDARMQALLAGLVLLGMSTEADAIRKMWDDLVAKMGYVLTPLYRIACPTKIIGEAAKKALEGTRATCGKVADNAVGTKPICDMFNTAWQQFWKNTENYYTWEKKTLADLKAKLLV